ncbi:hypothetical protein ACFYUY_20570 [Kitasatospora sp. NPDC004745]|uniref:hypothetical protein n=1 Tax=Kitasatospora sp. NPDC004745 TaxID=3364019 RepID=UPI0036BAC4F8
MLLVLELLYLLLPTVCWAFLVRTRTVGVAVFAILAGLALALVGLAQDWYFTRAAAEVEAGYPIAAGLVVLAGGLAERRLRGPRPAKEYDHPVAGSAVAITAHALAGSAIAFGYGAFAPTAFLPSAAEMPLPPGVTVEHDDGGYCGSNFCSRTLTIGSPAGVTADQVEARLRAALAADGWTPGRNGALVHPHGWLVDRRVSEAFVSGRTVELGGSEITNAGY